MQICKKLSGKPRPAHEYSQPVLFIYRQNTIKVAEKISRTLKDLGHQVDDVPVSRETEVDVLAYDRVFTGSGVYTWLPGRPMQRLIERLREGYAGKGLIKPGAPRIGKGAIIYCTYGGAHTGVNEAIPAVKYMGAAL